MENVKFLEDHHFAKKGEVIKLDPQTTDTFVKMGICERSPLTPDGGTKEAKKENAKFTPKVENAALN